jgi:hypothetical protein
MMTPKGGAAAAAAKKKRDKIFDNTYDTAEISTTPISFSKDALTAEATVDEQVDSSMIEQRMEQAVERCDWAVEILGRADAPKTVTKQELNSVFKFIFEAIGGHSVEVFSWMEKEMDLDPSRFYDALSNSIKTELIEELRKRGYLKGNRWMLP